jgi:hypothetical protein
MLTLKSSADPIRRAAYDRKWNAERLQQRRASMPMPIRRSREEQRAEQARNEHYAREQARAQAQRQADQLKRDKITRENNEYIAKLASENRERRSRETAHEGAIRKQENERDKETTKRASVEAMMKLLKAGLVLNKKEGEWM